MNKLIVQAKTENQKDYIDTIRSNKITFVEGCSGTGKSFIASIIAIEYLLAKKYEKVIISRPSVLASDDLGYLPGELDMKMEPLMRPIMDAFFEGYGKGVIEKLIKDKQIEIAPVAYLRGRTFNNSFIIFDETQNLTIDQFKLALTRFGKESKMVLTGDATQCDLPPNESGLLKAMERLDGIGDIGICRLTHEDIVREPIIKKILERL